MGIPLVTLRQWQRLRRAVGPLLAGGSAIADAAVEADFADQAHLARTARKFAGRTPASLRGRS